MNKTTFSGIILLLPISAICQSQEQPLLLPDAYVEKTSPNGDYLSGELYGGNAFVYRLSTNEAMIYQDCIIGNGNSISMSGLAVGTYTENDKPAVMIGGSYDIPESLRDFTMCNLHGITADGTRICGLVNSMEYDIDSNSALYYPIYCDVLSDGSLSEPFYLPTPEKDFFNLSPQYCSAVWISDDGKTILGQMLDYSGYYFTPIVYRQNEEGEWDWELPAKDLFNPNKADVPELPNFDLTPPEVVDYISDPVQRADYEEQFNFWEMNFYDPGAYPAPEDYMTEEEFEQYSKALREYEEAAAANFEKTLLYIQERNNIISESVNFMQNAMAMDREGKSFAATSLKTDFYGYGTNEETSIYSFDLSSGLNNKIESSFNDIHVNQLLPGGIIMASTSSSGLPLSYVWEPGNNDFIPIEDYLEKLKPKYAQWMKESLSMEIDLGYGDYQEMLLSGLVVVSDDFSVISGALPSWLFLEDYYYLSYIFTDNNAGLKSMPSNKDMKLIFLSDGTIKFSEDVNKVEVFDLTGKRILSTSKNLHNISSNLSKGFYVVRAENIYGNVQTSKIRF